ncbi:MAG: L-iditol 2-dehydrogenase [Gammaproteobacteria bacterium]|nr:L-iditol 2-dehydrogenase [Gammaproteobacteria bacterium]
MGRLQNKVALITGGSRGIGLAIAQAYAREGAQVMIADLTEPINNSPDRSQDEVQGTLLYQKLDITSQDSIDATIASITDKLGGIDILVNNAAVFDLCPTTEITREMYNKIFAVNVEGLLFMLQAVAKQMIAQESSGKIINFASQAGRRGEPLVGVYCASKAAVISITQSTGLDLIKHKINVNAISPGVVDTPMWDFVDAKFAKYEQLAIGEKKRQVGDAVPYGRMGKPDDLVGMAIFLASTESDYIVAQTYNVDGGNWMN